MRFAQLDRRERRREGTRLDDLLRVFQSGAHSRIGPFHALAPQQASVIVDAKHLDQDFVGQEGSGKGPIADTLRHRRHACPGNPAHGVDKGLALHAGHWHVDTHLRQRGGVDVGLDRPGLEREAIDAALPSPDLRRPRLDIVPVEAVGQVENQAR